MELTQRFQIRNNYITLRVEMFMNFPRIITNPNTNKQKPNMLYGTCLSLFYVTVIRIVYHIIGNPSFLKICDIHQAKRVYARQVRPDFDLAHRILVTIRETYTVPQLLFKVHPFHIYAIQTSGICT